MKKTEREKILVVDLLVFSLAFVKSQRPASGRKNRILTSSWREGKE
jgi:hypothetical protein